MAFNTLLDKFITSSPQKFITRYHYTRPGNIKNIVENGLVSPLWRQDDKQAVFTSASPRYWRETAGRNGTMVVLTLPKEWYVQNQIKNPDRDVIEYYAGPKELVSETKIGDLSKGDWIKTSAWRRYFQEYDTSQGGLVSTFRNVPKEFISKICSDGECYGVDDWMEKFGEKNERNSSR